MNNFDEKTKKFVNIILGNHITAKNSIIKNIENKKFSIYLNKNAFEFNTKSIKLILF